MLETYLKKAFAHSRWADEMILEVITKPEVPDQAREIFAHLLTTPIVWSSRVENLTNYPPVWPKVVEFDFKRIIKKTYESIDWLVDDFGPEYDHPVAYVSTNGQPFNNTVGDILLHLITHGAYHRGQVNHLLRQVGLGPLGLDYILYARQ